MSAQAGRRGALLLAWPRLLRRAARVAAGVLPCAALAAAAPERNTRLINHEFVRQI